MDTLTALIGDDKQYTKDDVINDKSFNLYYYAEADCKLCNGKTGIYYRQVLIGISDSFYTLCDKCSTINMFNNHNNHNNYDKTKKVV
jgi:hypothetical protein